MLNLFEGKETKALRRALELTKQKMAIEKELASLRALLVKALEKTPNKAFELEGEGLAVIQESNRPVIDMELLYKMVQADSTLLEKFTKEMVTVKLSSLEKYLGSNAYNKLVQGQTSSKTVRFIVK